MRASVLLTPRCKVSALPDGISTRICMRPPWCQVSALSVNIFTNNRRQVSALPVNISTKLCMRPPRRTAYKVMPTLNLRLNIRGQ